MFPWSIAVCNHVWKMRLVIVMAIFFLSTFNFIEEVLRRQSQSMMDRGTNDSRE